MESGKILLVILLSVFFGPNSGVLKCLANNVYSNDTLPSVTIPQGTVKGLNLITRKKRNIFGFVGVPFAEPPVGILRFANPLPARPWTGILYAVNGSNECPQFKGESIIGNEDCLYMNVYTPRLPVDEHAPLLPVLMYLYGGAFDTGSNDYVGFGPEFLLDTDIVLVVPNYRLSMLGFLSTGDEVSPGNYGLKDQVLALKWIRDNIKFFGGDPNQVTLGGESAGSFSVNYLALSETTTGLFQRYISQSGAALGYIGYEPRTSAVAKTFTLAKHFNCSTNSSAVLVECLRGIDTSEILNTTLLFEKPRVPAIIWTPTDEPNVEGAILIDSPTNLITSGKTRNMSCIIGVVRDEGLVVTADFYARPEDFEAALADFDDYVPNVLNYIHHVHNVSGYTAALKKFYFNDNLTINRSILILNFTDLVGDSIFNFPTYKQVQIRHERAENPTYFYTFEYRGTFSSTEEETHTTTDYGVAHSDDMFYIFPRAKAYFESPGRKMSKIDYEMVDIMVELWSSFVIDGKPTTSAFKDTEAWDPYSTRKNHLRIGNGRKVSLEEDYKFHDERMKFWDMLISTFGA